MWLGLWLLAACTPDSSPNHLGGLPTGDTSVAPTGDTAPVTAPPSLAITQPAGIRDLRAAADADATLRWTRRRDGLVIDGPVVSALEVFPGDTWDVVATGPRGTATAEHVVAPAPGGNVLFVVIDDVGIDHFGAYGVGVDPPQTPRMDALADEGVRFRQAYASPNCSPTRGELMSGRHARRTGLGWIVDTGHRAGELPIDAVTLPEALRTARSDPWANTALGKWHLAGPEADDYLTHANRSGFDRFAGTWGNPIYRAGYGYVKWDKLVDGVEHETEGYLTTDLVDDALLHIASLPEPWFLYVAFHAAHTPLSEPPAELIHTPLPKNPDENVLFNATVEALDTELGRLLDGIPAGVRADTTIILLGDNGTPGHAVDPPLDPTRAKSTPFEQGVRVPLVVAGPHVAPGTVQNSIVHVVDLFTLVGEIAGVPLTGADTALALAEDGTVLDGQAMLPLLTDPEAPGRGWAYSEGFTPNGAETYSTDMRSLHEGRWALVRNKTSEYFFDLGEPPTLTEGEDLLTVEALPADAFDAWSHLTLRLDAIEESLVYEGR